MKKIEKAKQMECEPISSYELFDKLNELIEAVNALQSFRDDFPEPRKEWKYCEYCSRGFEPYPDTQLHDFKDVKNEPEIIRNVSQCSSCGSINKKDCQHPTISSSSINGKLNNLNCAICGKDFMPKELKEERG